MIAGACSLLLQLNSDMERKERSRIRAALMDNLRGLLCNRKINKVPNARIRELHGVVKEVDERMIKVFPLV